MRIKGLSVSYWFAIPALLIYCLFFIYPSLQSFYYSLTDWNGINPTYNLIGLENFRQIFADERFHAAFFNTLKFAVGLTIGQSLLGLVMALLLNMGMRLSSMYRAIFFAPQVISLLANGYIWSYILTNDGSLNQLLRAIGLGSWQQSWFGNFRLALWSLVGMSIWIGAGYCMVIFLSNLQSIPSEVYEAAEIDGAKGWKRFVYVTLPLLVPSVTINMVLGMIYGLKAFDIIMSTTHGGPGYATETVSTYMYQTAFVNQRFGESTSMGIVLFMVVLLVSVGQILLLRRKEVSY